MFSRLFSKKNDVLNEPIIKSTPTPGNDGGLRNDALTAKSADELLNPHMKLIDSIKTFTQLDDERFDKVYMALFRNLASWYQQLPASETHHHAHLGGLLEHSIEVGVYAARISGRFLYIADGEEKISQWQALYCFAMTSAGLLHDAGKMLTDVDLIRFKGDKPTPWSPTYGPLKPGEQYIYRYNAKRKHGMHDIAALPVILNIMPKIALDWIWQKTTIRDEWLATIGGRAMELGGDIGRCVIECDSVSTGDAMQHAPMVNAIDAAQDHSLARKPKVHALALKGILLSLKDYPPNQKKMPFWVSQHFVACVVPRTLDCIKAAVGHESQYLPENNNLIYDQMADNGMLILTIAGKSVHSMMFEANQSQRPLAVILVKRAIIDPEQKLATYQGRLLIPSVNEELHHQIDDQSETKKDTAPAPAPAPAPEPIKTQLNKTENKNEKKTFSGTKMTNQHTENEIQEANVSLSDKTKNDSFYDSISSSNATQILCENVQYGTNVVHDKNSYRTYVTEQTSPLVDHRITVAAGGVRREIGQDFTDWLKAQILTGNIALNQRGGSLHIIKGQRLALVTPAVFTAYARDKYRPEEQSKAHISAIQHAFQEMYTLEKSITGQHMIQAHIVGIRKRSTIHVMVLTAESTQRLGLDLSGEPNVFISLDDIR